jgi:glycosyltransferase involved in cell wall biosynthesis
MTFRVAVLSKDLKVNGGNRVAIEVTARMRLRGWDARIFVEFPTVSVPEGWISDELPIKPIDAIDSFEPDVGIATYFTTSRILNQLTCHRGRLQYVQARYNPRFERNERRALMREALFSPASSKVVVSHYLKEWLSSLGVEATVVPPGLNHEIFYPLRRDGETAFRVLIEGDLRRPAKRVPVAYACVPAEFEIWGLGPVDHGLHASRMWVDPPQGQLSRVYSSCHALVKLARGEGLSLAIMEAMACGVVPVCSDEGGHRDFCVDGFNSVIVKRDAAVSDVLTWLRDNEDAWHALSTNARATAHSFEWDRTVTGLEGLFLKTRE